MLMGGGALLYLTGVGPLQRALQRLVALALPAPIRAPQAGQGAAAGQPPPAPQWTFLGELQAVIVGFFSSLIPGMPAAYAHPPQYSSQFLPYTMTRGLVLHDAMQAPESGLFILSLRPCCAFA